MNIFVLMPFSSEFNEIYELIIRKPLEDLGWQVHRADEAIASRSIMHDVIQSILDADLIVADLTGANPNVYYELGIAHAFEKKVILLAQETDELPFDLQGYRVITYSSHFAIAAQAVEQLKRTAETALDKSIRFGNPITDYYRAANKKPPMLPQPVIPRENENVEIGAIDIKVDLEAGIQLMTNVIIGSTDKLNSLTPLIATTERQITAKGATARQQQIAIRTLAKAMDDFSKWLNPANSEYREGQRLVNESIDAVFAYKLYQLDELDDLRSGMETILAQAEISKVTMEELAGALDVLPPMEREFDSARRNLSEEIKSLTSNIELSIAGFSRVIGICSELKSETCK